MDRVKVFQQICPTIFMIEDRTPPVATNVLGTNVVGTAFALHDCGYLVTAKHVVMDRKAELLRVMSTFNLSGDYAMGTGRSVSKIFYHPTADIAVLKVHPSMTKGRSVLQKSSLPEAQVGQDVLLIGYAMGTEMVFCDDVLGGGSPKSITPVAFSGMISALVPSDGRPVELLVYDCTTFGGNSGAPLVDGATGQPIGVHIRGLQNHMGYSGYWLLGSFAFICSFRF